VEGVALWLAIGGYALALAGLAIAALLGAERFRRAAYFVAAPAWALHGVALLSRWVATGHAPCTGPYEGALIGAWFVLTVAGVVVWQYRPAVRALPVVLLAALLILARGLVSRPHLAPLAPMFRSNWLVLHVLASWLAFGGYLMATALAAYHLWLSRRGAPEGVRPAVVDELSAKLIAFGFVSHTAMLASGALWAHGLWGRYWGWDPLETWTLVSWLIYAVYLHLRFTLGWKGARASWLAVGSVAGIVVTFYGIGIVSYVHSRLL
jgi:ABC-type transport system involved in cytochrome c biogenesis permease subunit